MEYLVIDTESCTGRADDGSLCSLGYAVCDRDFNILKQEDILINPLPKRFSVGDKKNAKRTGVTFAYTVEEFRKAPRFNQLYDKLKSIFNGRIVIGFSMANDIKYLNNACDSFNLPRIEYEFYDVQHIYQLLYPNETSIGLKTLNEKYGIEYVEHRSDEDASGSVILLKRFLENANLDFKSVVEKYNIITGKNTLKGYHIDYSISLFEEKFGLKRSKRIQGLIFSDYVKKLPFLKTAEKVCFSYKIEKLDVNYIRTLIDLSVKNGLIYTHDTDICNIYVTDDKEDKRLDYLSLSQRKKIKIMTLEQYSKKVGYKENFLYNDNEFLINLYETLI